MELSIEEYLEKESNLKNLDSYTIFNGIPIWRIVRTRIRRACLDYTDKTVGAKITSKLLFNVIISFFQMLLIIFRRKHYDNIIFPHPRLFKVGDKYIERLSDPLIEYSNIKESYILFERWQNGVHHKPRMHSDKCIYWDFVPFVSIIISKLFGNLIVKKYNSQISELLSEYSQEFEITSEMKSIIRYDLSCFIISYKIASPIIKACSARRIFLAPRTTFNYAIALGKQKGLTVYELQHGIALGESTLDSGKYHRVIDPDYYLVFGEDNISNYLGIPIDRIINIGYAYGEYVKNLQKETPKLQNRVLVVSEPHITTPLLRTVQIFAEMYPDWDFDFRCHPQEALKKEHKDIINNHNNLHEVANIEESFSTINKYPVVIGENSSVLFEALFLGKKVGRINFNGLKVATDSIISGGFIINAKEDFGALINDPFVDIPNPQRLYSEFQPDVVNNLK